MSGQIIGPIGVLPTGGGTDANATAWAAAVVTAGGTVSGTQLGYVSTLITAYKAAGIYTLLDNEWLYASENAFTAKVSIVSPYTSHTVSGSPVFTINRGYNNNGLSAYLDTGYASGTNYTQNANSFGAYVFTSRSTPTAAASIMGTHDTAYSILQVLTAGGVGSTAANDTTFEAPTMTNGNGNYILTRTSSSSVNFYKNALSVQNFAATSLTLPAFNFFVLGFNSSGSVQQLADANDVVSSAFMGNSLNATQAAAKNAALNTYMTSVGANVY